VTEVSGGGHAAQDTTVGDLIREWLDLAKPELSPTTARGYDWIIKTYITPTLDKVPCLSTWSSRSTSRTRSSG
jgi:hypothetical protein